MLGAEGKNEINRWQIRTFAKQHVAQRIFRIDQIASTVQTVTGPAIKITKILRRFHPIRVEIVNIGWPIERVAGNLCWSKIYTSYCEFWPAN